MLASSQIFVSYLYVFFDETSIQIPCQFFLKFHFHLFIYILLCCVFIAMLGLSFVVASGSYSLAVVCRLLIAVASLVSPGSVGSVLVAHGPKCPEACGIFLERGSNLCPLHRQADSSPLDHQGSSPYQFLKWILFLTFDNLISILAAIKTALWNNKTSLK